MRSSVSCGLWLLLYHCLGVQCFTDSVCDIGFAPPPANVWDSVVLAVPPSSYVNDTRVGYLLCPPGHVVCGISVYRLKSVLMGNVFLIRDMTLQCCHGTRNVTTISLVQNYSQYTPQGYNDLSSDNYYRSDKIFSKDVVNFSLSTQSVAVDRVLVVGTQMPASDQLCPPGNAWHGVYGAVSDGGGNMSYMLGLGGVCSVRCAVCPSNYYCVGNSTAIPCPANAVSGIGSTSIAACSCNAGFTLRAGVCYCPAGTFLQTPSLCAPCPVNAVCTGDNQARPCPSNSQLVNGSCVCSDGYFNDTRFCQACQQGSYCVGGVQILCWNHSTTQLTGASTCDCLPGFFGAARSCAPCPEGFFCPGGASSVPCQPGTYSSLPGASQCTSCPANSGSSVAGGRNVSVCECASGFTLIPGQGVCVMCPSGYYCPGFGVLSVPCRAGTYHTGSGLAAGTECSLCGNGTYSQSLGASLESVCTACGVGTFQPIQGAGSPTQCRSCPPGSYGNASGLHVCPLCQRGTIQLAYGAVAASSCTGCMAGTYQTGEGIGALSGCLQCPKGTYQTGVGQSLASSCILCAAGTYQSKLAQPFLSACILCDAGEYQTMQGAQDSGDCRRCAVGTYQSMRGGQQPCLLCATGTYGTAEGAKSYAAGCLACARGTYQTGLGAVNASSCQSCDAGTMQPELGADTSDDCLLCPEGTYQSMLGATSRDSCSSCAQGTYQPGVAASSSADCLACGTGRYQSSLGATAVAQCIPCPAGTYQTSSTGGAREQCMACAAGLYQPMEGAVSSKSCTPCSAGTYQTVVGASSGDGCVLCGAGTYQSMKGASSLQACILCPRGTFQTGIAMIASSTCIACGAGEYSSGLGMGGSKGQVCLRCAAGTYYLPLEGVGASSCTKCEPGKFQTAPGQTNCSLCKEGTYQPFAGVAVDWWCKPCDSGTYSSSPGAASFESCTPCPRGTYSNGVGATNCTACDYGKYSPDGRGHTCFSCMSGTYAGGTGYSACESCAAGSSMSFAGASTCVVCPPGQYQFLNGSKDCFACSAGTFQSESGATTCLQCPKGFYQSNVNRSQCLECPPGLYSPTPGLSACAVCAAGTYQPNASSTTCMPCSEGGFQAQQGMTSCASCSPGYFQKGMSASACSPCNTGEYQTSAGATGCDKCRLGSYRAALAADLPELCLNCSAGYYGPVEGATACTKCAPGAYALESGTTVCNSCPQGTFQSSSGSSGCDPCRPGTYSAVTGLTSLSQCVACSAGTYSTSLGATVCLMCDEGMFSDLEGTTNCSQCQAGTYVAEKGWKRRGCTPCPAGTFSGVQGAVSPLACSLCPDGMYSSLTGMTSSIACTLCPAGTVSVENKSLCRGCVLGEFCPAGYHTPILCVPGLWCNGTHMDSMAGLLTYTRGNCTGVIPCPKGTQCWLRDSLLGKGILHTSQRNQTQFVVFEGGTNLTTLSCQGQTLEYGYARLDWPYTDPQGSPVLYRLAPMACAVGTYLHYDTCVPCPAGTFSSQWSALAWDTCVSCPAGTYSPVSGASACVQCPVGGYCKSTRLTTWQACKAGTYQPEQGGTGCLACSPGSFTSLPKAGACIVCDAGAYQPASGATRCLACAASQFSSPGDNVCSNCGADLVSLDPGFSCTPPSLPDNKEGLVWITLRGEAGSDECLSTGTIPAAELSTPNQVAVSYVLMSRQPVVCTSTLYVVDRPELRKTWVNSAGSLRRPVSLRVIPFNATFYPELCKQQGFGVLFTVADEYGAMLTDLTGARAMLSILDTSGQNILFSMGCDRLPNDPNSKIPVGVCRTSFCPTMSVIVRVALSWMTPVPSSLQGQVSLNPGPMGFCPPTSSWMAAVQLLAPSVPYFPGGLFEMQVLVLNPPPGTKLVVFRFALRVLGGVTLLSFQSSYSIVTETQGNVLSVVGDASQGGGAVLGTLRFRVDAAVSGVGLVAQIVPQSFQFTLANAVPYTMLVRTSGFSCRSDGYIDVLLDTPRTTALIAAPRRKYVINWRRIQNTAMDSPTGIHVVSVNNVMHSFGPVLASCTSVDYRNFDIASCDVIRAGNTGNASGLVRVRYQSVVEHVELEAWVPATGSLGWVASPGGMSGRYRVRTTLVAGTRSIANVDATPFLSKLVAFGVALDGGQWRCISRPGTTFTIGVPTMYTSTCGKLAVGGGGDVQPQLPKSFFLVSGPLPGVSMLGSYVFPPAVISAAMPFGGLILVSPQGLSIGIGEHTLLSPLGQLVPLPSQPAAAVVLQNTGASARCVQLVLRPSLADAWVPYTAVVPVFPAGPRSLHVTLSSYVIISVQSEADEAFIPSTIFVVQARLIFSDGTQLLVQNDPRLRMTSNTLEVNGLAATASGGFVGNGTLVFTFKGIACVTTSLLVRVVGSSVQETTLLCPQCPSVLASDSDPLSQQLPREFPSSFPSSFIVVRRLLLDGRVVMRSEPVVVVSGTAVQVVNGGIFGVAGGVALLSTQSTPGQTISVTVLHRWATAVQLLCNGEPCGTTRPLAPVDDGASLPPFSYATSVVLSLSLTLVNGSTATFPWLGGFFPVVNDTDLDGLVIRRLEYGALTVRVRIDSNWDIHTHEISNGFPLRVERMRTLMVAGPFTLKQVHCSGFWEEAHFTTTATLTDGVSRVVPAVYQATPPLVMHHSSGLFHASSAGTGEITASFGGQQALLMVEAVESSRFFTGLSLDFLPSNWVAPTGTQLSLAPTLTPILIDDADTWFRPEILASKVLQWTSNTPSVISVTSDGTGIILRGDSYHPVTVTAEFRSCAGAPVIQQSVFSKDITVNVVPTSTGDIDIGQDSGIPLGLTPVGGLMEIPVFLYVSSDPTNPPARLQSYMVEVEIIGSGVSAVGCYPGSLPNSQCAVIMRHGVYRAVGAFSQSQLTGRISVITVRCIVLLDALAVMQVRLLQGIVSGGLIEPRQASYVVRLGTGPLTDNSVAPLASSLLGGSRRVILPPGTAGGTIDQVYGDTDGDGYFTAMDVLFMENYIALVIFNGVQQVCVLQGRCQSTARLTAWQLQQLKPVRHPGLPATRPDGSDVLFLLMALVGKTFFLASVDVKVSPGALIITIGLRDYEQMRDPVNAAVQLGLVTTSNRGLAFDTPYSFNSETSTLRVTCRRTGDGFVASTLPTAFTADELSVGLRLYVRALDELGSPESAVAVDRSFVFKPSGPISVFNILGSQTSLPPAASEVVTYLPTLNCEFLCDDASLFLDHTLSAPVWLNSTAVSVAFASAAPPVLQGFWPGFTGTRLSVPLPPPDVVEIPSEGSGIMVGAMFNLSLPAPPAAAGGGHVMGLYTVQSSPPVPLLAVYGAESPVTLGGSPVFFTTNERTWDVYLEFRMPDEGDYVITVTHVDSSSSSGPQLPAVVLQQAVVGVVGETVKLRVTPRCLDGGVILWSRFIPSARDEPCTVDVEAYGGDGARISGQTLVCTVYPCLLQAFGQVVRPSIRVFAPLAMRILVQKPVLSVGHRTQWRIVCDTSDPQQLVGLTVTERALRSGLVRAHPPNALAITTDSIRGVAPGFATVTLGGGGRITVGINVSDSVNQPRSLDAIVFSAVDLVAGLQPGTMLANFQSPSQIMAGSRFFMLLRAVYSGGYTLLLNPTPGVDGILVTSASDDLVVSQLDGSVLVRTGAVGGTNLALVTVEYQGVRTVVRGNIAPLAPSRLEICCDVALASARSNMYGHPLFPSSFAITSPRILLNAGESTALRLDDSAIRVAHDASVVTYDQLSGNWTLTSQAPVWGTSEITVYYTHPKTMDTVHATLVITLVAANQLSLTGPHLLRRIHCSSTLFQSGDVSGTLRLAPAGYNIAVDITSELVLRSSDQAIARLDQRSIRGVGVGTSEITASARGQTSSFSVSVTDESVVIQSLTAPAVYDLRGVKGITRFPLRLNGSLEGGGAIVDAALLGTFTLDDNPYVSLDFSGGTQALGLLIRATSLDPPSVTLHAAIPGCSSPTASTLGLSVTSLVRTHATADTTQHAAMADVEIGLDHEDTGGTRLTLWLVATPPVLSFYIQLHVDTVSWTGCTRLVGMPFLSDCVTDSPSTGSVIVAGAASTPFPPVTPLVGLTTPSLVTSVWGFVEVFDGISAVRYSIRAGELTPVARIDPAPHNSSVSWLMPGLPVFDTATLSRAFRGLFSNPRTQRVRDVQYQLLVLTNRQRNVDVRVYSNEFELSVMFFVTDRFLRPDPNATTIRVLFHTDQLDIPGGTTSVGEGVWVAATHVLDGWYAVELRQKIPRMSLAISFAVSTPISRGEWLWHVASPVEIGSPLPVCPRSATQTATFLASYQISLPDGVNLTSPGLEGLLGQVACSVQVASRRVMLGVKDSHTLTLTVGLESLARVHQANLVLMGGWLSDELERRLLGMLPADVNLSSTHSMGVSIERGDMTFINDTNDPPRPCPEGYYFSRNGTYTLLPPHSVTGEDCYDMQCLPGYTTSVAEFTGRAFCIPTPVTTDIVWVCVVVILTGILALAALACCIKFALWTTAKDITDVVFDPVQSTQGGEQPAPTAPPAEWLPGDHDDDPDNPFQDSVECEAYFRNVVAGMGMDDLSMTMMMDEDSPRQFSPYYPGDVTSAPSCLVRAGS